MRRSALNPEEDRVMYAVIGAALAVHRELGPGFIESIYHKAMLVELSHRGIAFETELPIRVEYQGVSIPGQRVDLVVERLVVVEIKAVTSLENVHTSQVISYLKSMRLRAGLLINFRVALLRHGIKRIVL